MKPLPPVSGRCWTVSSPTSSIFNILVYLSTTCVREAVRRQIPVVMTLHDYWLICQRGRFLKPDLSVCPGQTDTGCARCFHHVLDPKMSTLYRWLKTASWVSSPGSGSRRGVGMVNAPVPGPSRSRPGDKFRPVWSIFRTLCASVSLFLGAVALSARAVCGFWDTEGEDSVSRVWLADRGYSARSENPLLLRKTEDERSLVFGYIGVVDPVKGVHLLVEAFQALPQAELRIYGGEAAYAPYPDEKRFRSQLANSARIRCMGRYEQHELGPHSG